jgi:hypothetical protein
MNYSFLRQLLGVHRTPIVVNRTVRALRRCIDVITPVAGCRNPGGAGAGAYLTEESGSRFFNVAFGTLDGCKTFANL